MNNETHNLTANAGALLGEADKYLPARTTNVDPALGD